MKKCIENTEFNFTEVESTVTLADKLMLVDKEALVKLVFELTEEIALLKQLLIQQ